MADNADETVDSTNDTTEEVDKTEDIEETDDTSGTEDLEALQEKNKRLFERAKKAEAEAKLLKAERLKKEEQAKVKEQPKVDSAPTEKQVGLTPMDAILLSKASVTEAEDIEEIVRYTNYQRLSNPNFQVKDALKDKTMLTILRDRAEQRATAEATNTGNARRGSSKPSDEQVLANVNEGKFPDDPEVLAKARHMAKFKK